MGQLATKPDLDAAATRLDNKIDAAVLQLENKIDQAFAKLGSRLIRYMVVQTLAIVALVYLLLPWVR